MAVDQLPGQVREFVAYLDAVLARLDQGAGWCAVFWQRDPDGMQACLDGREIPPWDVVEALLQDLAMAYGPEAARAEAERARPLHAAAQTAHDARPGGRDALRDRFDVMLREQRYAAERQAQLGRLLAAATTQEQADALRLDLAWARDDHERAVRRCAELQSRMTTLDHRTLGDRAGGIRRGRAEGEGAFRQGQAGDAGAFRGACEDGGPGGWADGQVHGGSGERAWADGDGQVSGGAGTGEREDAGHAGGGFVDGGHGGGARREGVFGRLGRGGGRAGGDQTDAGHPARAHGAGDGRPGDAPGAGFPDIPQQRGSTFAAPTEAAGTGHAPHRPAPTPATGPGPAEGSHPGYGPRPTAPDEAVRPGYGPQSAAPDEALRPGYGPRPTAPDEAVRPGYGTHQPSGVDAFEAPYDSRQAPTGTAPDGETPRADTPRQAPPAEQPQAPAKQRKRRRGSARFAGMEEAEAGPVVVPPTAVPDLPTAPAAQGRTPRGARFAGAADAADGPQSGPTRAQGEKKGAEDAALRETADTVATLVRLRSEGRTGEAHALLVEVAHWPADRFPLLAAELQRAGLGADWATLLWEAASLPAERLVAAADALVAAGRSADGEQVLRQGVARPAAEIGAAVLALVAEGRRREVSALLDAYVRVRTPEEAARSAEPDPRTLVPLLLAAAKTVSQERHWDLVHALRVAGFSA
ncbi:hypothetical protein [Streptomyces sp. NPDC057253]|uniref:hypothetical protein n=1 Tax=Streptomyces sp. NPDC057253 TaxID=3346069 RepID=UPI00363B6D6A